MRGHVVLHFLSKVQYMSTYHDPLSVLTSYNNHQHCGGYQWRKTESDGRKDRKANKSRRERNSKINEKRKRVREREKVRKNNPWPETVTLIPVAITG